MPRLADVDFVQLRWVSASEKGERFLDPNGSPVLVDDTVMLDMADFDSVFVARAGRRSDRWDVIVRLSRPASARFGASTATHIGQQLAVIVDHSVTELPVVQGALGSIVPLLSEVGRPAADSLAIRINHAITLLRPWQPVELHHR